MEERRRKSALNQYIDRLDGTEDKSQKSKDFYIRLRRFYRDKWSSPLILPTVQGVEVNLFRLYDTVMALGGWQKVAAGEKWSHIAEMLGCKNDVVVGDHAIKLLYMRYLSKFEQVETIGDVDDLMDGEMTRGGRGSRGHSFFATNECPISSSRINDYVKRDERGNIVNEPDYGRLMKSLLSGLPNEVDFAMNISLLLSHTGPRQLRVSSCPNLLTLLVAHAGIFDDEVSLQDLSEAWIATHHVDYRSFWANSGVPKEYLVDYLGEKVASKAVDSDADFFTGIIRDYSVKDSASWRLNQIATILRNLSFEPCNRVSMTENWSVMKFLFLCALSDWPPLYTAAYDTLSNLATDINLKSKLMQITSKHVLLRIIQDGISSHDKFKVIRSMEILTGMCTYEGNETILCEFLNKNLVQRIFELTGIRDIMLCVYTLECLYQISEMGDAACDVLCQCRKSIDQLVAMATLEAVSFGAQGLAGMKVVEYHPQNAMQHHPQQQQQQHQQHQQQQMAAHQHQIQRVVHHAPPPAPQLQQQLQQQTPQQPQQSQQQTPHLPPNASQMTVRQAISSGLYTGTTPAQTQSNLIQQAIQNANNQQAAVNNVINAAGTSTPATGTESHVEQLTEKWIRTNCVYDQGMSTPRGELYAAYVDDLRNQYHSLSGSLAMFSTIMKNMYQDVMFKMADNGIMIVAQGIRLVRPHRLAPAASQQVNQSSKQPGSLKRAASSATVNAHPLMKRMLTNGIKQEEPDDTVTVKESVNKILKRSAENYSPDADGMPPPAKKMHQPLIEENGFMTENIKEEEYEEKKVNGVVPNGIVKNEMETPKKSTGRRPTRTSQAAAVIQAAIDNGILDPTSGKVNENMLSSGADSIEQTPTTSSTSPTPTEAETTTPLETAPAPAEEATTSEEPAPTPVLETDFVCEWLNCGCNLLNPPHVLQHVTKNHVKEDEDVEHQVCRWTACSDSTPRSKWSLITHLQDVHCRPQQLKLAAQRRREGIAPVAVVPRNAYHQKVDHPGYAKSAAFDAIKRHAFNFLAREITDEPEGPVTKSIRLTSCLILRNVARYSAEGRHILKRHEPQLCWLALSRLESSGALAQLLSELSGLVNSDSEDRMASSASSSSLASAINPNPFLTPSHSSSSLASAPGTPTTRTAGPGGRQIMVQHRTVSFAPQGSPSVSGMAPPQLPYVRHQPLQVPQPQQTLVQTTPVRAEATR